MVVSHERSASTSAAITAPPVSFEPPGPRPFRPGPRSPAWPRGHKPSWDRPSCALSRPEPIKLTVPGKHSATDKYGKELDSLYEAHLHALHMFEKLIQFIPDSLSPTCDIEITSAAGEPVLTVFLPALAAEERFQRVLAHHLQRAQAWP